MNTTMNTSPSYTERKGRFPESPVLLSQAYTVCILVMFGYFRPLGLTPHHCPPLHGLQLAHTGVSVSLGP